MCCTYIIHVSDLQAQLDILQSEIAQAAKKTGIASAAKLATIAPKKELVGYQRGIRKQNYRLLENQFLSQRDSLLSRAIQKLDF
jgi:hypothetical protein